MYGIEYSTYAKVIVHNSEEGLDVLEVERRLSSSVNSQALNLQVNIDAQNENESTVNDSQKLLAKLQNLSKCPDYLVPKLHYTTSSVSLGNSGPSNISASTTSLSSKASSTTSSATHYTDDFILLSEFSEIEGPKPLLTIPTDGGTGFNKNEYSLHLMCVDFHSHIQPDLLNNPDSQSHSQSSSPSPPPRSTKFKLTKDTSIINYWDTGVSVSACVHHFNLYDLEARGFVRPFCLAYVSYDPSKPVTYFEHLRTKFAEITDLLKKSNFNQFRNDLEQRCADLNFTREVFQKWSAQLEANFTSRDEMKEYRSSLVREYKLDAKTCARLTASAINEQTRTAQLNAIDSMINELESVLSVVVTELKLKNWLLTQAQVFDEAAINQRPNSATFNNIYNESATDQSTDSRNRSFTYPLNNSSDKRKRNSRPKKPPILFTNILIGNLSNLSSEQGECLAGIDFHHLNQSKRLQQHKTMKRLQQLSVETARPAINELRLMHRYFSTPAYLIKYRELCNGSEAKKAKASKFWSISLGDCDIADFSTHIDTFNLNKYELIKKSNCVHKRGEKSDESVAIINNDASFSAGSLRKANFSFSNIERLLESCETENELFMSNSHEREPDAGLGYELYDDEVDEDNYILNTTVEHFNNETTANDESDTDENYKEESEYDFVNSLLTIDYKPYNQYSTNFDSHPDFASLFLNTTSSACPAAVYSAYNKCKAEWNIADKLMQISEFNFEETLKQMLANFGPFFHHLLYSLLKGRPVICVTRYCNNLPYLNSIIDCLSNFIPNSYHCLNETNTQPKYTSSPQQTNCQEQCQPGQKPKPVLKTIFERRAIKLNDLKYCKLFGLCLLISKEGCCSSECSSSDLGGKNEAINDCRYKHHHKHFHLHKNFDDADLLLKFVPITVRNYVSVLDLDQLTFTGPAYKGTYLTHCVLKCKQLQQDSIAYLYLLSKVVKYYVRVAFLYNYSMLFNAEFNESQRRMSLNYESAKEANLINPQQRLVSNKRERVLKYFQFAAQLNNQSDAKFNRPNYNSSYNSLASSISSFASSFIKLSSQSQQQTQQQQQQQRKLSQQFFFTNNDFDLLRMIVAYSNTVQPQLQSDSKLYNNGGNSINNAQSGTNLNFDQCDFNVVNYMRKTLKVKQVYLYNFMLEKKKMIAMMMAKKKKMLGLNDEDEMGFGEVRADNCEPVEDSEGLNEKEYDQTCCSSFGGSSTASNSALCEVQLPLLIEYEEITCFTTKK